MVKTTYVRFVTVYQEANNVFLVALRTMSNHKVSCLFVESFENGFATVQPPKGTNIHDFAEIVCGCLIKGSNFEHEVLIAYRHDVYDAFNGIKFKFNNVTITVTTENADPNEICEKWKKEAEIDADNNQEISFVQKSGRISIVDEVLYIDKTTNIEFKNEKAKKYWENLVESSFPNSSKRVTLTYARFWAKYMQKLIAEGKSLNAVAKDASYICDIEGISVFMYIYALKVLISIWKYGDALQKWCQSNPTIW